MWVRFVSLRSFMLRATFLISINFSGTPRLKSRLLHRFGQATLAETKVSQLRRNWSKGQTCLPAGRNVLSIGFYIAAFIPTQKPGHYVCSIFYKKGAGCKEEGMGGCVFQDPAVQAAQNLTKRIVRVVAKRSSFKCHPLRAKN